MNILYTMTNIILILQFTIIINDKEYVVRTQRITHTGDVFNN